MLLMSLENLQVDYPNKVLPIKLLYIKWNCIISEMSFMKHVYLPVLSTSQSSSSLTTMLNLGISLQLSMSLWLESGTSDSGGLGSVEQERGGLDGSAES